MSALFLLCAAVCSEPSWLGLPAPRVPEKGKMTGFPIGAPFGASEPVWEYASDWVAAGLHNRPRRLWEVFPGFPA